MPFFVGLSRLLPLLSVMHSSEEGNQPNYLDKYWPILCENMIGSFLDQYLFSLWSILNPFNTEWSLPSIALGRLKSSVGVKGLRRELLLSDANDITCMWKYDWFLSLYAWYAFLDYMYMYDVVLFLNVMHTREGIQSNYLYKYWPIILMWDIVAGIYLLWYKLLSENDRLLMLVVNMAKFIHFVIVSDTTADRLINTSWSLYLQTYKSELT